MTGRFIVLLCLALIACGDDVATLTDAASPVDSSAPDVPVILPDARTVDSPPVPELVTYWGGRGTTPGLFIEPSSVELDSAGFVYVAGHENRFQKFTADGELVDIFGMPGVGDGEFNHPHGLAVDRMRGDLIYVGDQENHRLQVFTTDGAFVRQWGDDLFQHIHDIGIDPLSGELFVGDYELHILRRFSATGEPLAQLATPGRGPGQFNGIWGVSTDSASNIFIADTFNRRVQKLDRDGNFVTQWDGYLGEPFSKPTGVFVDHTDTVYVCDSTAEQISVFDADGNPLQRWEMREIVGFQTEPEDIVIDATGTKIYVAEVFEHRVLYLSRNPG